MSGVQFYAMKIVSQIGACMQAHKPIIVRAQAVFHRMTHFWAKNVRGTNLCYIKCQPNRSVHQKTCTHSLFLIERGISGQIDEIKNEQGTNLSYLQEKRKKLAHYQKTIILTPTKKHLTTQLNTITTKNIKLIQ